MNEEETALQWARRNYGIVADHLKGHGFTTSSNSELLRDQAAPEERRIAVVFFDDPQNPHLRVVNQPKPNLLPSLVGDEPEAPEAIFFDVIRLGSNFGWVERDGADGSVTSEAIVDRVQRLFELA